jgi:hypothetical protein
MQLADVGQRDNIYKGQKILGQVVIPVLKKTVREIN